MRWKGESIHIPRRMSRALLYYMALAGRSSRVELRQLFWPEEPDPDRLRANLRVALARLRASLPDPDLLEGDTDTITLHREKVSVDALRFAELAEPALRAAAPIAPEAPLPERLALSLRQAADLWRAPNFLAGFSFAEDSPELDQWQLTTTQHYEELHLRVLTRLTHHFSATGDFDAALHWAQEGLQIDPFADELHHRTLRCLLALGRAGAALAHAQALMESFANESLEISAPLAALIRQVRHGSAGETTPELQGWPAARLTRVALVGRTTPLLALQAGLRRGGVVSVWGEAGAGKTRLAYEFYATQQPRPRLLLLSCLPGENYLPFQPLSDALHRSIRQEEWRRLKPAWLGPLSYMLPGLADLRPAPPADSTLSTELQLSHLFEALRQLLLEISRGGRLLVVLDGAQWCDEATLAALAYLNERRLFADRGLLLVAVRPEELNPQLERWLGALRGTAGFQEIRLNALDPAETIELAQRVLDRPVPAAVGQRLRDDTGGNPLFLLETLFALLENAPDAGLDTALARLPLGGNLHNLLRQRLARLHPPARQVAAAAAVLRDAFTPNLLEAMTQLSPDTVLQALDELFQAQLIQIAPNHPTAAYAFVHGQVREVLHLELSATRLRLLHLRAARALTAEAEPTWRLPARLAYHYEQAGELLPAFEHWLQAGRLARAIPAITEALQAFRAAERLVPNLKARLSDETLYELYSVWGETQVYDFSDTQLKQEIYLRLLRVGEERHSALLIGAALSEQANLLTLQNDPERALETFRRAAHHLETLPDPLPAAQNAYRQGWYLLRLMRYEAAARLMEPTLAHLQAAPTPAAQELRSNLEFRLGMLYLLTGWPLKAQQMAAQALRQTASSGAIYGHLVMARAKLHTGEHLAAQEHVRLGLQLAAAYGSIRMIGLFSIVQFTLELALGEIDAAWEHAQAAVELAENHALPNVACMARVAQGDIFRLLGDLPAAISAYRAGLAVSQEKWDTLNAQLHLGMAWAEAGQVQEGLGQVTAAYTEAFRIDLGDIYIQAITARTLLLLHSGNLDEALELTQSLTQIAEERQYMQPKVVRAMVLGLVAIRRGDEPAARAALAQANHHLANPFWELFSYQILSRLGPLAEPHITRVDELLSLVLRRTRDPELRPLAEAYCSRNRAALLGTP